MSLSFSFPKFYSEEEAVRFHRPVYESGLSPAESQEVWSRFEDPGESISSSQGSCQAVSSIDGGRRRNRMMSNREPATRPRLRKMRYFESLTVEADRLKVKNEELKRQLNLVSKRSSMVRRQNERLWSEFVALQARLSELSQTSVYL